ncbi:MAG TPA: hypothetical protein DET40_04705 [Lentisphaeria bacterium]|nr:MAG: hypothetical protein A2X45_21420 [Lentisphaerae bacterium GWF2_50_93]HCE42825.1 hypothetical protein [Lentisphaeria bacterium]
MPDGLSACKTGYRKYLSPSGTEYFKQGGLFRNELINLQNIFYATSVLFPTENARFTMGKAITLECAHTWAHSFCLAFPGTGVPQLGGNWNVALFFYRDIPFLSTKGWNAI